MKSFLESPLLRGGFFYAATPLTTSDTRCRGKKREGFPFSFKNAWRLWHVIIITPPASKVKVIVKKRRAGLRRGQPYLQINGKDGSKKVSASMSHCDYQTAVCFATVGLVGINLEKVDCLIQPRFFSVKCMPSDKEKTFTETDDKYKCFAHFNLDNEGSILKSVGSWVSPGTEFCPNPRY